MPAGYKLVWNDEFSTDGLPNSTRWTYDVGGGGFGNQEIQYYTRARTENVNISGGLLSITARKESYSGKDYTSARLITEGKASWTYGFYEIRAKVPCGTGIWPAIWMMGTKYDWPDGGEIDIMEYYGKRPNRIFGTIHTRALTDANTGSGNWVVLSDECTVFHDYQLLWTPTELKIAMDGSYYHTFTNANTGQNQWPFDDPQYLLLNVAVGGTGGGPTIDDSIFPATMQVDYVRIYQKP